MNSKFENKVDVTDDKVTLSPIRQQESELEEEAAASSKLSSSSFTTSSPVPSQVQASPEPEPKLPEDIEQTPSLSKDELRELFSEELETLREETYSTTVKNAKNDVEKELAEFRVNIENELKQKYNESLVKLESLHDSLESALNQAITENEADLVELSFMAVAKILGDKATDKSLIRDVVAKCIQECKESQIIKVKVNKEDYAVLDAEQSTGINFEIDNSILPGGCIIETDKGTLDARLDSQVERFKSFLLETYNGSDKE